MGAPQDVARLTAVVRGHVQGVGFRSWVRSQALALGLVGHARNTDDGRVEVVAEGATAALAELLARLEGPVPGRPGRVTGVSARWAEATGRPAGFVER
ncbi:acylphosphatase [Quadrisphaera sp. GCM10027208]|uniref:acylphosphatase n=1 Tax=Quadrisphaera sp. GCM10027208 TaxID=3273423 RepID=UPI0036190A76